MDETQAAGPESTVRIPLVTEIMSYLGGVLAVAGVAVLVGMFWDTLGVVGQVGLTGVTAAACLAGGVLIGRIPDKGAHRLQEFLLMAGVLVSGACIGIGGFHVADALIVTPAPEFNMEYIPGAGEWGAFAGFLGIAVVGAIVYWRYRFLLQQLAFALGVFVAPTLAIPLFVRPTVDEWANPVIWVTLGVVWAVAGIRRKLPPGETAALVVSGAGILFGLFAFSFFNPGHQEVRVLWPLWVSLGGAALLLGVGVALKKIVLTGFGAAGVMIFIPFLLAEQFKASILVPVLIIMLGAVLIAIAVFLAARRQRALEHPPAEDAATSAEDVATPAGPAAPPKPLRRVPVVAELLGYVGGAFALGGGIALIVAFADVIGIFGQIAVCAVAAIAGLAGGFAVGRIDDRGAQRLEQFLLFVGVAGVGAMKGLAVYHLVATGMLDSWGRLFVASTATDWALFLGATAAAIVGGIVWWFRRTWLQELAYGVPVAMALLTSLAIPQTEGPDWVVGAVLVALALVWGALGYAGRLRPTNAALTLASLGVVGGFLAMASMGENTPVAWALWAGLAATIALLVLGLFTKRYAIVVVAAIGLWQFLPAILGELFPDSIAGPIIVLVMGVVFIGAGVAAAIRAQKKRAGATPLAT